MSQQKNSAPRLHSSWRNLARLEGDIDGMQTQLDRGLEHWFSETVYAIYEARILFLRGNPEQARAKLANPEAESYHQGSGLFAIHIALVEGDIELALTLFEQAVGDSDPQVHLFGVHPVYAQLRAHPRFQGIMRQIGLDDESVAKLKIPPFPL